MAKKEYNYIYDEGRLVRATSIKQIEKLSKQSGKSQRQIMRELKRLAADNERCFKHFKIAGIVMSVFSVIIFAVSYLQYGKSLFSDVYALIVDLFIEAASWIICELADRACQAIPVCGFIIGFAVSWAIEMLISAFFTSSRKKRMTKEYTAKMKKAPDGMIGLSICFSVFLQRFKI